MDRDVGRPSAGTSSGGLCVDGNDGIGGVACHPPEQETPTARCPWNTSSLEHLPPHFAAQHHRRGGGLGSRRAKPWHRLGGHCRPSHSPHRRALHVRGRTSTVARRHALDLGGERSHVQRAWPQPRFPTRTVRGLDGMGSGMRKAGRVGPGGGWQGECAQVPHSSLGVVWSSPSVSNPR